MRDAALIVAGGRGERAGEGPPKQYRDLGGAAVIARTLARFAHLGALSVAIRPEHRDLFDAATAALPFRDRLIVVEGGRERADSVRAGLEALAPHAPDRVLIHDAARPFAPRRVVDAVLAALETHDGAIAAIPIVDALWREAEGLCVQSPPRAGLWRAQTPQGFRFETILRLHRSNPHPLAADDAALAVAAGLRVALVESEAENFKLTRPGDFARAARQMRAEMQVRIGTGFDVHAFGPGDHVMLCGVAVPHERGFVAHSDGDVALHALTDAVLGALALGDIGEHFPPSDPRWAGAESGQFLRHALALAAARGFAPVNLDVTLICERPKIGPHVPTMRAGLAQIAGLDIERVSVKATTSEKLGFTGRGEGIAAQAVAAMEGPR